MYKGKRLKLKISGLLSLEQGEEPEDISKGQESLSSGHMVGSHMSRCTAATMAWGLASMLPGSCPHVFFFFLSTCFNWLIPLLNMNCHIKPFKNKPTTGTEPP